MAQEKHWTSCRVYISICNKVDLKVGADLTVQDMVQRRLL